MTYQEERAKAIEAAKPLARKLLAEGWGHDGAMLILSEALFTVDDETEGE